MGHLQKKLVYFKTVLFILAVVCFPLELAIAGRLESFTHADQHILRQFVVTQKPGSQVRYRVDEAHFADLFPRHPYQKGRADYEDRSFYAGQIVEEERGPACGSGMLLEITGRSGDHLRVLGVTALHVFVEDNFSIAAQCTRSFRIGAKTFAQGGTEANASFVELEDEDPLYGLVEIDTLLLPPHPKKDICFFEGEILDSTLTNQELKDIFSQTQPQVAKKAIQTDQEVVMYHYPLGVRDQRTNKGKAEHNGHHFLTSLVGSSGAALYSPQTREIVGIHTGARSKKGFPGAVACPLSEDPLDIVPYNMYAPLIGSDLETAKGKSGINLYRENIFRGSDGKSLLKTIKGILSSSLQRGGNNHVYWV